MDDYREKILKCPFCECPQGAPCEVKTPFGDSLDAGRCGCGAIYVYDRSGRKLGEAYSDAIAFAYDWDYDAAFSAGEGEYEEAVIRYDPRSRRYYLGDGTFKDRSPKFYFIKRKKV